jgi:plastocyanin
MLTGSVQSDRSPARCLSRAAGVGAVLAALTLGPLPASAAPVVVDVRSMSYAPATLTVVQGTRVVWRNTTSPSRTHDVVSSIPDIFDSGRYEQGQWAFRFDAAGTYTYICSIHDQMLGVVHVPLDGGVVDGPDGRVLRVTFARHDLLRTSPLRYAVYRRDPGSTTWTAWLLTRHATADLRPAAPGDYDFVMRIRNVARGWHTRPGGDSPVLRLHWDG